VKNVREPNEEVGRGKRGKKLTEKDMNDLRIKQSAAIDRRRNGGK